MERSWYWRVFIVVGVIALGVYYSIPSAIYLFANPEQRRSKVALQELIPTWLPKNRLNFGIDLQGGLHLVMGVDTEKAIQDRADRVADEIVEALEEKDSKVESARRTGDGPQLKVVLEKEDDFDLLKEVMGRWEGAWVIQSHSGRDVFLSMEPAYETHLSEEAVAQAQKTLRNRIDKYGVTEPEVRKRGTNSILIQIAGLTAEEERSVKEDIIGRTAQLEFKIVDDQSQYFAEIANEPGKPESIELKSESYQGPGDVVVTRPYLESKVRGELQAFVNKHPPPADRTVGIEEFRPDKNENNRVFRTWLLTRKTELTGDALTDAFARFDDDENQQVVIMNFDRRGADIFHRLTRENTKRKMAIVLDDVVDSAPIISGPIPNGTARITLGGYKSAQEIAEEAKSLATVLKAGALPAPVFSQEERTVGATLGNDAVNKGKQAMLWSLLSVVAVMIIFYRASGVIAVFAMGVNMLLLFAALSAFDATLTLPGIAGFALTMGMAVDANVIQFERIRDELRLGKTARAAVDGGFDKSFSAIFDSNVTTLLASFVLFQYGSGPIRGFALTLGIGVVINTLTSVIVPRLILDYLTKGRRLQKLSI